LPGQGHSGAVHAGKRQVLGIARLQVHGCGRRGIDAGKHEYHPSHACAEQKEGNGLERGDELFHKLKAKVPGKVVTTLTINLAMQFFFRNMTGPGTNRYIRQEPGITLPGIRCNYPTSRQIGN
jgi:hypothetical protein